VKGGSLVDPPRGDTALSRRAAILQARAETAATFVDDFLREDARQSFQESRRFMVLSL
jgi:hypothetical protein